MKKWKIMALALLIGGAGHSQANAPAQETLESFKQQIQGYYHYLVTPEVNNFSCKISSGVYIDFIRDKADSNYYYPLKFIQTKEDNRYYVLQPLPTLNDSLRREALSRIQNLKNLFNGLLTDLQKFYFQHPLNSLPPEAAITFARDTVSISFSTRENDQTISMDETYTRGGQLGRITWKLGNQQIVIYPAYREARGKWICTGWNNQVYQDGQVISGLATRVEYLWHTDRFLPLRIDIITQAKKTPGEEIATGGYVLFLKEFTFNEDISEITQKAASKVPPRE